MTREVAEIVEKMSASELVLWHGVGGEIPDSHRLLFVAQHELQKLADSNGTSPVFRRPRRVADDAARRAVG
jgi:hypothetical protein